MYVPHYKLTFPTNHNRSKLEGPEFMSSDLERLFTSVAEVALLRPFLANPTSLKSLEVLYCVNFCLRPFFYVSNYISGKNWPTTVIGGVLTLLLTQQINKLHAS